MVGTQILAACIMMAAQSFEVPPTVLAGIYKAEGGRVGLEVLNTNGSYDLGPMQINTIWIPELSKKWGVNENKARAMVRDDPCVNVNVAAWILRKHINETQNLGQALQHYHSRTSKYGEKYKKRVLMMMEKNSLLSHADTSVR